jgi:hypothetical protein
VKKVNKKSPALREKSPALLCIFSSQTAHSPWHYTHNAPITKIALPRFKTHYLSLMHFNPPFTTL